jgi:hypothetical protein
LTNNGPRGAAPKFHREIQAMKCKTKVVTLTEAYELLFAAERRFDRADSGEERYNAEAKIQYALRLIGDLENSNV